MYMYSTCTFHSYMYMSSLTPTPLTPTPLTPSPLPLTSSLLTPPHTLSLPLLQPWCPGQLCRLLWLHPVPGPQWPGGLDQDLRDPPSLLSTGLRDTVLSAAGQDPHALQLHLGPAEGQRPPVLQLWRGVLQQTTAAPLGQVHLTHAGHYLGTMTLFVF